jgi:hypothetical protein
MSRQRGIEIRCDKCGAVEFFLDLEAARIDGWRLTRKNDTCDSCIEDEAQGDDDGGS